MPLNLDLSNFSQVDAIIPRCEVIDIPAGASPKNIVVELPGPDGARVLARYYGFPILAVSDLVRLLRRGSDGLYDVIGTDGNTAMTGAPSDAQYVVLAADATLTSERVLTEGQGIGFGDGGPGGNLEVSLSIDGLSEDSAPDDNDMVALYSDGSNVKQSRGDFLGNNSLADGNIITTLARAASFDHALADELNTSGVANHYWDTVAAGPPTEWTEATAAFVRNVNTTRPSAWYLLSQNGATPWVYKVQTSITLESISASSYGRFIVGPFWMRDGKYSANLGYRFGMYRNNAGAIDTTTYIRVYVLWNSASSQWEFYGEEKDGSAAHATASPLVMTFPLVQPLYFSFAVRNHASKQARADIFVGDTLEIAAITSLLDQAPTSAPTWGQVWLQYEQTARGAGVQDYVFIGATDYKVTGF